MKPRIHVITIAVDNLERAVAFYQRGLGFHSDGVIGTEWPGDDTNAAGATAVFSLDGGLMLAVYPRTELAKDAGVPVGARPSGEFSIGHAVTSRADVDAVLAEAQAAGATLIDGPHDRPWGVYSGYFQDPDGHLWEIIYNPALDPDTL